MPRHWDFQYKDNSRYDWLALPHNVSISPNEAVVRPYSFTAYFWVVSQSLYAGHPHREHWHQIGRQFKQRFHLEDGEEVDPDYVAAPFGSCNVQVVRSVSDWSHGVLTEHSIQNACKLISNCVYF